MNRVTLALTVALGAFPAPLAADEQQVNRSDVPERVIQAVTRKYPKARLLRFERETQDRTISFEVSLEIGKKALEVTLSQEGKILEESLRISAEDLPPRIRQGLAASKYAGWTVRRAESVVLEEKNEALSYELLVVDGEHVAEVVMDPAGNITKEGREDDDD